MKIFAIKKDAGFLDRCEFYTTKELARIQLHILADKYRKEASFKLEQDSFSYKDPPLPEDDGGWVTYTTTYTIVDIDVRE